MHPTQRKRPTRRLSIDTGPKIGPSLAALLAAIPVTIIMYAVLLCWWAIAQLIRQAT